MQFLATARALTSQVDTQRSVIADSTAPHNFVVELATHKVDDPAFRVLWRRLVDASDSAQKIYQTPEFFRVMQESGAQVELLSLVRLSDAAIVGVVPIRIVRNAVDFHVGPVRLYSRQVEMASLLGSVPAVAAGMAAGEYLATQVLALFPAARAVFMHALPQESRHWKNIEAFNGQRSLAACRMGPWQACHMMPLPPTFDAYLDKFSSKKRYNLNRQLRQLASQAGELELVRIEREGDVEGLTAALSALTSVAQRGPLLSAKSFTSYARHGLLQSYVLQAAGKPIAVIIGTRSPEVLHIHNIFVDKQHLALSAGTSAMHLAIRDVIGLGRFRSIDFGYGTPNNDFRSSHVTQTRAQVLLFDRMHSISFLFFSHALFSKAAETVVAAAKWTLRQWQALRKLALA